MASAILSVDDLNDFINPGVACIKPVETLPKQKPATDSGDPYQVTTEDVVDAEKAPPAQISLTDCLACSGCVTSAEAVLVSLQSHNEVLQTLDRYEEYPLRVESGRHGDQARAGQKIFVASISPQTRASLAATYDVTERQAGYMIEQLLSGPLGLRGSGAKRTGFAWVVDTNAMREACLFAASEEVTNISRESKSLPLLTSACPGWICYAEKTHPHILPHLSRLKSPQALTGTLVKSLLSKRLGIAPSDIWHMAVMPCFDKKLEASRAELTSHTWHGQESDAVRDVDCVITARELLMLAESRDISFPCLPKTPLRAPFVVPFPDRRFDDFLFHRRRRAVKSEEERYMVGTSGGYLYHILKRQQSLSAGSSIQVHKGRNADVVEFSVVDAQGATTFKGARYYGFRNIQNLVRRLKPVKISRIPGATRRPTTSRKPGAGASSEVEPMFVEVMACPGGCTNGGGQIKVGDIATLRQSVQTGVANGDMIQEVAPAQKEWLAHVDEAYWSADSDDAATDGERTSGMELDGPPSTGARNPSLALVGGIDHDAIRALLEHWSQTAGVELDKLIFTTYRVVESDVGKTKSSSNDVEKVSALAVAAGGGW